jgi:hypothetical protein
VLLVLQVVEAGKAHQETIAEVTIIRRQGQVNPVEQQDHGDATRLTTLINGGGMPMMQMRIQRMKSEGGVGGMWGHGNRGAR